MRYRHSMISASSWASFPKPAQFVAVPNTQREKDPHTVATRYDVSFQQPDADPWIAAGKIEPTPEPHIEAGGK
jgi:hypothetical protein